ncbi:MAG: RNA polymerase sigma factor [Verrucomicrobia bacterium]|nr:RNA polymerase sigma factor [Verrucomicrobiota bacterium]
MLEPPPDIEDIWMKPGPDWSEEERVRVKEWLNSEPQRTKLCLYALPNLGWHATWSDAEDVWQDFNVPSRKTKRSPLDGMIRVFKANLRPFPTLLFVALKRFCWKRAKKLSKQRPIEPPRDKNGEILDIVFIDENSLLHKVKQKGLETERAAALLDCIKRLLPKFQAVVTLRYFEGCSTAETTEHLGISISLVKARLSRGLQRLKECLKRKGLKP